MKVFRVVKDKDYTTINNTIFKDKGISCKTKGFFATIMSLPPDWDFSVNGIKAILLEGKSSVYSFIDELEANGYLTKNTNRDDYGKIVGIDYTFFETPINKGFNPQTDLQETALQETAEPRMENRPQLSTNIIKDLNNKTNAIDFDALLVFFNKTTGKNLRLINPKTKAQFNARLKEGYTKEDVMKAIRNCSMDKYHIENPKYLTPEFISRPDKMEKYANATTKQATLPTDWYGRELTIEQQTLLTPEQLKRWKDNKVRLGVEGGYLKPIER
jgi:uncharacterized phage protein (TIGR02220 family)